MGGSQAVVDYVRKGGVMPPNDESLHIADDGSFTMWRSASTASIPPSPVGEFAGKLTQPQHEQLAAAASLLDAAGDLSLTPPPGAVIETIRVAGATASLGIHQQAPGPWDQLIKLLRPLLGELTRFPKAALRLEMNDQGRSARLVAVGHGALELDLGEMQVHAFLWRGDQIDARWSAPTESETRRETTGDGWNLSLPFDHGFELNRDVRVSAIVELKASLDDETMRAISLQV